VQLELRDPLVAVRGDRIILRRPSPGETLGGGVVVDPSPKGRHKRFDEAVLKSLESLSHGSPADVLLEAALALGPAPIKEIVSRSRLESAQAESALKESLDAGSLILLEGGQPTITNDQLLSTLPHWNDLEAKTFQIVGEYHKTHPLRKGIPREELKSKLKLQPRIFNALLAQYATRNTLKDSNAFLSLPSHKVTFDGPNQAKVQGLMRKFAANPFGPPSVKECQAEVGEEVFAVLLETGELTTVSAEVVFRTQDYGTMVAKVKSALQKNGQVTLAEVRDLLGTTRKYIQALLEHLDALGVTLREGDARKLKK
jgi:selenocysteine-specific elongation factor